MRDGEGQRGREEEEEEWRRSPRETGTRSGAAHRQGSARTAMLSPGQNRSSLPKGSANFPLTY